MNIWERIKNEPVLLMGLAQAIIAACVSFGLNLTGDQIASIMGLSAAVLAIFVRQAVTPVRSSGDGGTGAGNDRVGSSKPSKSSPTWVPFRALLLGAALLGLPGCAFTRESVVPVLNDVLLVAEDAASILSAIHTAEVVFFRAAPNPDAQSKIERALSDAEIALDVALQTVSATKDISSDAADAAFVEFRKAYQDLVMLAGQLGIAERQPGTHRLALRRGVELKWYEPLALQRRVGE